ncbi:hypothetical protein LCGC14_2707240 [marine sediment metagenome]|uniref:Uncharacterized protein n=1 Tax=marine sediment metagenome TaxID=412755 RepID=A0A0F8ZDY8_9ZZZZ
MTILKVKSKRTTPTSERKLVGVFMPQQVCSYLSLFALTKEITKAVILREMIGKWYEQKSQEVPGSILIAKLADKVLHEWKLAKLTRPEGTLSAFKNELTENLRSKGIDESIIDSVMSHLNLNNEKNEETTIS